MSLYTRNNQRCPHSKPCQPAVRAFCFMLAIGRTQRVPDARAGVPAECIKYSIHFIFSNRFSNRRLTIMVRMVRIWVEYFQEAIK